MKAINFPEQNIALAKDQDEYNTLPIFWNTKEASATFAFQLDEAELAEIQKTGVIWLKQLTFGRPFQPISISVNKNDLIPQ